jgi:hypothetical protein
VTISSEWGSGYEDDKSDPRIVKRMVHVNGLTVSDLIDWCVQHDLSPYEVTVSAAHLKWASAETDEERAERLKWEKHCEERTLKWEHETYERLSKKFGL